METILNANTVDANLTNGQLSSNSVYTDTTRCSPLAAIGTQCRTLGPTRTGTGEVVFANSTSDIAANPSTFQSGDADLQRVQMTIEHLAVRAHVSCPEGLKGLSGYGHVEAKLKADLQAKLWARVMAKYTTAALGAADVSVAGTSYNIANTKTLISASSGNPRALLVSTAALGGIASELVRDNGRWLYPGLGGGVWETTFTGDVDVALCAGPSSLGYLVEKPLAFSTAPSGELDVAQVQLDHLGIPAWRAAWFAVESRSVWLSFEMLFGVALVDATAASYAKAP